jgi:lipopolysaccharide export system protein LptA
LPALVLPALVLTAALCAGPGFGAPAAAQGLGLGSESDEPIEINADEGIEWRQGEKAYIARGNASAARGGVTVRADTLTAHYRPTGEGGTDIWRIDADGRVRLVSQSGTAYGDKGAYDVAKGILVLKGQALKLETATYTVTARDSLEYWEPQRMAVARGDAQVVSQDQRLEADVVTAYFGAAAAGESGPEPGAEPRDDLERVEAFGDVHITTPTEVARGERGVYDVQSGIATL